MIKSESIRIEKNRKIGRVKRRKKERIGRQKELEEEGERE